VTERDRERFKEIDKLLFTVTLSLTLNLTSDNWVGATYIDALKVTAARV
jgi:hypothetical protein